MREAERAGGLRAAAAQHRRRHDRKAENGEGDDDGNGADPPAAGRRVPGGVDALVRPAAVVRLVATPCGRAVACLLHVVSLPHPFVVRR